MRQVISRLLCVAFACAVASPAQAQNENKLEIGVGYSFLEEERSNLPAGWLVSIAGRVTDVVSVVGEVGGNYWSFRGTRGSVHTFQAGPRFAVSRSSPIRPYGQFLLGAALAYADPLDKKFVIEPGGGVDFRVGDRAAVRFGVGFPMLLDDIQTIRMFRFHAGFVF